MKTRLVSLTLLVAGAITATAAIHAQSPQPVAAAAPAKTIAGPDPAAHVEHLARLFRAGDLVGFAQASLPPAKWDQIRTAWDLKRKEAITDEDRREFGEKLAEVTAPDAVDKLMAQIEPKLEEARPQVPGALLMGFGAAHMAITSPDSDLTQDQRDALQAALPGLQRWAGDTDFLSSTTLRDALTLLTDAVRRSGVQNLDQLKALPLEELLRRADAVLVAAKDAVQLYGIDIDAIADSLRVDVLENDGSTARVRTTVTVFGAPVFTDYDLVLVDGQWYGKHAVVQWSVDHDADEGDDDSVEG